MLVSLRLAVYAALLSALSAGVLLGRAHACKCASVGFEDALARSAAVFEGRVRSVERIEGERMTRVSLAVVRTWKGLSDAEEVSVSTSDSSASCGFAFEEDTTYLVYATQPEGADTLRVSSCGRTRSLDQAHEDLSMLGAGVTPVAIGASEDAGPDGEDASAGAPAGKVGGCASAHGGVSSALLILIPGLMRRFRRR